MKPHQKEIFQSDMRRTDAPAMISILFQRPLLVILDETLDALCNVLRQFCPRYGSGWGSEIFGGYLATPATVTRPLDANGYAGTSALKDSVIFVIQPSETTSYRVGQGDTQFIRMKAVELDGGFQADILDVAPSVGIVRVLSHT